MVSVGSLSADDALCCLACCLHEASCLGAAASWIQVLGYSWRPLWVFSLINTP